MTEIYFLRHGNSVANKRHQFAGVYDAGLTRLGRKQAKITAKALKNKHFDTIYASNIPRAIATALYVAKLKKQPVYINPAFAEINFGILEGLDYVKYFKTHAKHAYIYYNDYASISFEGGESVKDSAKRFRKGIEEIAKKHEGQAVLIVTHSVALGNFISYLKAGFDEDKINKTPLENCSITKIEVQGDEIRLIYANDCSPVMAGNL